MAEKLKEKPFNLLYKFEPQKNSIDKLYDFVMIQGRLIVVGVMVLIIIAFVLRFPLDKKLNDEINRSNENLNLLNVYSNNEAEFRNVISRTESAKKFINLYAETPNSTDEGQIRFFEILKRVNEIEAEFKDEVVIVDYSFDTDNTLSSTLSMTGYAGKFTRAEEFREKLRLEKGLIEDVLINNLGAAKEGMPPKFSLNVKIRNK